MVLQKNNNNKIEKFLKNNMSSSTSTITYNDKHSTVKKLKRIQRNK